MFDIFNKTFNKNFVEMQEGFIKNIGDKLTGVVSVKRIVFRDKIKAILKDALPDDIDKMEVSIPLPKELLDIYPAPKDCTKLALSHMLATISNLLNQNGKESNQFDELLNMTLLYTRELFIQVPGITMAEIKPNYNEEWEKLIKKYEKDAVVKESIDGLILFIILVAASEDWRSL